MFYSFKRTHTHAHMSDKSISHESAAHATSKKHTNISIDWKALQLLN